MLSNLLLSIVLASNLIILCFITYYLVSLKNTKKRVEKKENEIDSNYHHVVDEALSKERKILDDATNEADQIISNAKYLTNEEKQEIDNTIKNLVINLQKEGEAISHSFTSEYSASVKQMSTESLTEFKNIMIELQTGLRAQIQQFNQSLLPQAEKEIETYKASRMQEIDKAVTQIIQKASQDIFNKSISTQDHEKLIMESLEKAKKEGLFN